MHPATPVPAPSLRGWALRRWLRRVTAGTTTAAVVLLAAPAVVTSGPGAQDAVGDPPGRSAAPTHAGAEAAGAEAPGADAAGVDAHADDLRLVGHRKPHPHRTIKRYRVRPGDTPSAIAVRFHAWTAQLMRINHTRTLYAGDVILVPVVTRAVREHNQEIGKHRHGPKAKATKSAKPKKAKPATKATGKKKAAKPAKKKAGSKKHAKPKKKASKQRPGKKKHARAPHRVRHAHGWHHRGFSQREVRRVIVRKANRHGVNPALALAVAWQESGWQHGRVSSAGAIGAMQIMPGTGRWMSSAVGRRLNTRDLYDNVTAGVVLLRLLRDEAGPRVAVAGYYQGLAGVRRYGMYRSTKQYVANVHALRKRIEKGWSPA